jgi:FecR-like protein
VKVSSPRIFPFVLLSSLLLSIAPEAQASKGREAREVRVASVQGDVRLSRGNGKHIDLNKPWEQAQGGELLEEGCALATDHGRAEIAFENGSTVYLAENSLLLFRELSAPGDRTVSRMTLATGTATLSLQAANNESYFINTPTEQIELSPPERFYARIDAYLDATAVTTQGEKGEHLVRRGMPDFQLQKGKTLFFQGGEIIQLPRGGEDVAAASVVEASGMSQGIPLEPFLQILPDFQIPPLAHLLIQKSQMLPDSAVSHAQGATDWDTWVSTRLEHRNAVTAAALKASGLPSPIPGLADLYERGTFFPCEPYGTCWEATDPDDFLDDTPQSTAPGVQSAAAAQTQANVPFQPQTVQWEELWQGWCSPATLRTITHVAHTPEELQKLFRKKEAAEKVRYSPAPPSDPSACENGFWIPHRGHYARVVTRRFPRHCLGAKCKPIHAPRPVWVRAGGKVGFVPAHPNDVKGKPPLNLKYGIFALPARPGQPVRRIDWDPSQKVKLLDKEFQTESVSRALLVSPPEIRARLMQEAREERSLSVPAHWVPLITYDYKTHNFMMAGSAATGTKSRDVPVGGIDAHGKIGSFADGRSVQYAASFARSESVASYRGGSFGSSREYGPAYSGGGHNAGNSSGSYSSGSSGSHSSGSSLSGGSSSHSSSGGGGSVSSPSSSSSSSSSSSGGSRGRP